MMKRFPVLSFLLLTFAISWSVVAFSAATIVFEKGQQIGIIALIFLGQFGPSIAALIVLHALYGRRGITSVLKSAVSVRQPIRLIALAIFLFPLLYAMAFAISMIRGAPSPDLSIELVQSLALTFLPALVLGLVFGGLSEELGWRGFLLPRLQNRVGVLGAGLLVAAIWSIWHLDPEHVATLWTEGWESFWELERTIVKAYLLETIPVCFIMAWLFNRSQGSVFLMILIHASSNAGVTSLSLLWTEKPEIWSETVTAVCWIAGLLFLLMALRQPAERFDAAQKSLGEDVD